MDATQYAIAMRYREAGAEIEQTYINGILRAYEEALDRLADEIAALSARIAATDNPTPGQLLGLEQSKALFDQLAAEYEAVAINDTFPKVEALAATAIELGESMAGAELSAAGYRDYAALGNEEAARLLDAYLNDADIAKGITALPANAQDAVRTGLMTGLLLGENPLTVARQIRAHLSNATRGDIETLTRTTMMGAQREAALANYNRNADNLEGWIWMAALSNSPGPCLACLAQHGTIRPLSERMVSHPRCRCTMAPKPKTSYVTIQTGEEWLASLPEAEQRRILGPQRHDLYKAGELKLRDLIGYSDGKYGRSMRVRSLAEARRGGSQKSKAKAKAKPKPKPNTSQPRSAREFLARVEQEQPKDAVDLSALRKEIRKLERRIRDYKADGFDWPEGEAQLESMRQIYRKAMRGELPTVKGGNLQNDIRNYPYLLPERSIQGQHATVFAEPGLENRHGHKTVTPDSAQRSYIETYFNEFTKMVSDKLKYEEPVVFLYGERGRAYAQVNSIHIYTDSYAGTIIHEYAHLLEDANPALEAAAQNWIKERAKPYGMKVVKFKDTYPNSGYRDDEVYYADDWKGSPSGTPEYLGKIYSWGSTEVISIGLQWMWSDPVGMARTFPELFDFIMEAVMAEE